MCLGAHSDDIEIGAGATVATLIERYPQLHVDWVVLSAAGGRRAEADSSARTWLAPARSFDVHLHEFKDGYFPSAWAEVKEVVHGIPSKGPGTLVLTHHRADLHQDHRTVAELAWNAFRGATILEYEIPKWDGDLAQPNFYVPVSADRAREKVDRLLSHFASQAAKPWFDADTFYGLLRLRGLEAAVPSGFAEAFHARKLVAV